MKHWKLVLGAGAACVACCAVPLLGGAAALGIGSGLLAGGMGALAAITGSWQPLLLAAVAAAGVLAAALARRRPAGPAQAESCGCSGSGDAAPACGRGKA